MSIRRRQLKTGPPILHPRVLALLLLSLLPGAELIAAVPVDVPGPTVAGERYAQSDNQWEQFKKVRRGGDAAPATAPDTVPATPVPQPAHPQTESAASGPATVAAAGAGGTHGNRTPAQSNKGKKKGPRPDQSLITAPEEPNESGSWWVYYQGKMAVAGNRFYDPHGIDYTWAYSRKNPLPPEPRIVVNMHGSGGTFSWMGVFGPDAKGDIEVRTQDAEGYNYRWREWWMMGADGMPYPGRRIAAALNFVKQRYGINVNRKGIVLTGNSMGAVGAVVQTMILPPPWRQKIAYSASRVGALMPRRIGRFRPDQYSSLPSDSGWGKKVWDRVDFTLQASQDPVVQGIHYRHAISSDDQFAQGVNGNTQLEFVNEVEKNRIGGAFAWVKNNHSLYEPGVNLPDMSLFEHPDQDITLDRAHPAFTNSTGNYPLAAEDRVDEERFPRGHYNMGLLWNHAKIVDTRAKLIFPLRYVRRTGIGKGVPDQPQKITVSVTPRRPRHFTMVEGETLNWRWAGGEMSGQVVVENGTVTINDIPLVAGEGYRNLLITRRLPGGEKK